METRAILIGRRIQFLVETRAFRSMPRMIPTLGDFRNLQELPVRATMACPRRLFLNVPEAAIAATAFRRP